VSIEARGGTASLRMVWQRPHRDFVFSEYGSASALA